jgi:hypothetical protein
MNALPLWDAEQRLQAAPVLVPDSTGVAGFAATEESEPLPGAHRGIALVKALESLDPSAGPGATIAHLLDALDSADAEAGIARVDTNDAVLRQRIARIVSGANLPSRGPVTRAREILSLLTTSRPA